MWTSTYSWKLRPGLFLDWLLKKKILKINGCYFSFCFHRSEGWVGLSQELQEGYLYKRHGKTYMPRSSYSWPKCSWLSLLTQRKRMSRKWNTVASSGGLNFPLCPPTTEQNHRAIVVQKANSWSWRDEWTDGWMDGWVDRRMDRRTA